MPKTFQKKPWFDYPEYHWKTKHAVIVGAGIAGCQMAWHLCQADWQVTLIERHETLAREASGNPVGVITPKMTSQESSGETFYTQCFQYTLSLLKVLEKQGKKVDWDHCGALQLAHNPREKKRWQALAQRGFTDNFLQLLDEGKTSQTAGIDLAYKSSYFPQAGWIKPTSFCHALSDHPNCKTIIESEALSLKKADKNWLVLNKDKKTIAQAEAIIICNGRDLFKFKQSQFLPHMPVTGQTTSALATDESTKLKTVLGHKGYLTPAVSNQNTRHIFGSTFEPSQANPSINPEADSKNRDQFAKYLPDFYTTLNEFKSAHSAVRMTTPDRFPYAGALPDKDFYLQSYHDLHQGKQYKKYPSAKYQTGLFMLGGLGSRGLTTSGLCAKSLCDLLENKPRTQLLQSLLKNCHPARFLVKALKQNSNRK